MRALIQRCRSAQVSVDGQIAGEIGYGMLVLLGLGRQDTQLTGRRMIDKLLKYRLFDDEHGKMGHNISQTGGGILLVSQFTLYANTSKGLRPDFGPALAPDAARVLYDDTLAYLHSQYDQVASGIFAADMQVSLVNDGPVTFMLEID